MQSAGVRPAKRFALRDALRAKHAALPAEHGAWVFLLSPLAIGLALGGVKPASLALVVALLAAFLIRQPVTLAVKALSGRRPAAEFANALFWALLYAVPGAAAALALAWSGFAWLFWLLLPALPVLAWHLWLVSRRAERRQLPVELLASGVLALAAPAAYGLGKGGPDPTGVLLWGLCWLQSAGSILYAYLRLAQRALPGVPPRRQSYRMAAPALWANLGLLALVCALALARLVLPALPLAFSLQPLEVAWFALHPGVGVKPRAIGFRQLAVSTLFTLLFILAWGSTLIAYR